MEWPGLLKPHLKSGWYDSRPLNMSWIGFASITPGTANRAYYMPILVQEEFTPTHFFWLNGTSINGNVDAGLYNSDGDLLTSIGSTAHSGASAKQEAAIGSPIAVAPGLYYIAIQTSSATASFQGISYTANPRHRKSGMLFQDVGAFPLPNPFTFADNTTVFNHIWVAMRGTV